MNIPIASLQLDLPFLIDSPFYIYRVCDRLPLSTSELDVDVVEPVCWEISRLARARYSPDCVQLCTSIQLARLRATGTYRRDACVCIIIKLCNTTRARLCAARSIADSRAFDSRRAHFDAFASRDLYSRALPFAFFSLPSHL